MDLQVKNISDNQVADFCSILKEVVMWLHTQGQGMWSLEQVSREKILSEYSIEEMFLGYMEDVPVSTMILQEEDDVFWPSVVKNESLFLHKLSVRRQFANFGLARDMVKWAKQEAQNRNKRYLRLDCAADRPKLCSFYESIGFSKVREQVLFRKYPTAFYEIEV
ncbi:GNAT family N-acetyltransferase [Paenibacillus sp. GCM10023248]|uniref:GNAT family N-acetyltransferase n=1 Tax=unclassified Paenibacillus TaxID=185978 RepID=UPI002378E168|nr:GNAT family N-acetyltransferase [Paenibacillus sp. MAHUQ-63]MDD9271740.1 GNAT family N-acetyltransferase [Paenibacillus sp. MAHUQ-63]